MAWKKKGKKDAAIVPMSEEDVRLMEEHVDELVSSQLPIGRVKKIVRLDPAVEMVNSEALRLMTKAAELFIRELGNAANSNALLERRKTVQMKDIDRSISKLWTFAFLEDALDGWPKHEVKKRKRNEDGTDSTILEETVHEDDAEEMEEVQELEETVPEDDDENNVGDDEVIEDSQDEVIGETPEEEEGDERQSSPKVDRFAEQF